MLRINRCKFNLHFWRYTPKGKLRFCDACGELQCRTKKKFINRWVVRQPVKKIG